MTITHSTLRILYPPIKLQDVIATPERPLLTEFPSPTDPHIYHEVHDLQQAEVQPIYRPIQAQLHFQVRYYVICN